MAYIGREPQIGNYQVCDAISVVNAQAAYTMQVNSVNVIPESVNHMIVSLNGVIQKPGSSYTISSSTITFSSNLATGDSIDFIYLLGNVLDLGTPSDDTVTGAKIVDNAINSEHYTDASIDLAHLSADSVDGSKIADNAINSEHYTDGSIDNAHIADDQIDSEHYVDGSIDTAHIADNQITLAKLAGGTDGNIISYDASGDPVAIATGNDGQVLTSAGAGAPPAFEDAAGGSWNLISTTTISNDATVLVEGLNSTYAVYAFTIHDLVPVAEGPTVLQVRYKIGGSVLTDGKYDYVAQRANGAPSDTLSTGGTGNDTAEISLTYDAQVSNGSAKSFASTIFLYNPSGTAKRKMLRHFSVFHSSAGGITQVDGCGAYNNSNAAVTGLQFYVSSGNLNTGVIKLYGIT